MSPDQPNGVGSGPVSCVTRTWCLIVAADYGVLYAKLLLLDGSRRDGASPHAAEIYQRHWLRVFSETVLAAAMGLRLLCCTFANRDFPIQGHAHVLHDRSR